MKRIILTCIIVLQVVFFSMSIFAMPPHPDLIKKYKKTGRLHELSARMTGMNRRSQKVLKNNFVRAGDNRVLVILVGYYADATATTMKRSINYAGSIFLGILILGILISALAGRKNNVFKIMTLVFILMTLFSLLILNTGCLGFMTESDDDDDDIGLDLPENLAVTTSTSVFNSKFNDTTGLTWKQYFRSMSNNNLNLIIDIKGPYTAAKKLSYYGKNGHDYYGNAYDLHSAELVGEAIDLAEADGVDFSLYDNDGDTYVDTVVVIHAGPGEESGAHENTIWSHHYYLSYAKSELHDGLGMRFYDGVKIDSYTIQPEYSINPGDTTIGILCHEFGHALGLHDLYDTSYETSGVGYWSLMSGGSWGGPPKYDGSNPAPLLAWERDQIGGESWVTITDVTTDYTGGNVVAVDDIETSFAAKRIYLENNTAGDEQYLIIEGKRKSTSSEWYVMGNGLLITHYHNGIINANAFSNTINRLSTKVHGVTIVEANSVGNKLWSEYVSGEDNYIGAAEDLFSAENRASLIDQQVLPNTRYYTDRQDIGSKTGVSGVSVTNISSRASFPITFNVKL